MSYDYAFMRLTNHTIYLIARELFYVFSASLIIFITLELIHPFLVLAYINISYVLIFWLVVGIVVLVGP